MGLVILQVLFPFRLVLGAPGIGLSVDFFLQEGADWTEHEVTVRLQLQFWEVAPPHLVEVVGRAQSLG